ncbi:hypothetical protein [Mycobacterium sp. 4858]|uniref:hypothetical protein n=1 Tax=Mycobacterium sp. 4858 TaxID=2057185 RepID=UPI001E3F5F9F|nr:hypothetical protein [Mycobacterium sp. 4858]
MVTPMFWRRGRQSAALLAVLLSACHSTGGTPHSAPSPVTPTSSSAPVSNRAGALFYAKAGSLYVSAPAGEPGRKLTDGPADTQPAPSPDLAHVAFVRKVKGDDYGGELWVQDLSRELMPVGPPRRLVDPAKIPQVPDEGPTMIASPRWSPKGQQVAFVDHPANGIINGGRLLVAATDNGALVPAEPPLFAVPDFAWSPDGGHIVWVNSRSDVRPVDVNVLVVGGASRRVAAGTNAFSVTYGKDGQTILFTTGDASGPDFTSIPFALRTGGIYSVPADKAGAQPTIVFTQQGSNYSDIAVLDSGAVAFTKPGPSDSSKAIQILGKADYMPRTTATDVEASGQGPAWGAGNFVAYLDTSPEKALVVADFDNRNPKRVDTGVDAFAWTP